MDQKPNTSRYLFESARTKVHCVSKTYFGSKVRTKTRSRISDKDLSFQPSNIRRRNALRRVPTFESKAVDKIIRVKFVNFRVPEKNRSQRCIFMSKIPRCKSLRSRFIDRVRFTFFFSRARRNLLGSSHSNRYGFGRSFFSKKFVSQTVHLFRVVLN